MAVERRQGPTPNGGVRSEAIYSDEDGKPCDQGKAARMEIVEYDATGNAIHRTHLQRRQKS